MAEAKYSAAVVSDLEALHPVHAFHHEIGSVAKAMDKETDEPHGVDLNYRQKGRFKAVIVDALRQAAGARGQG